ncbi:Antitoxin MqsA [Candidatus Methylomirabilis lanthanidiphila]|uniref:Antitoxin MqsA n=1 Tax=Candidatus Methylomirabilis lanthanidiphila TaxID=2211376 RepID=A0A564ZMR0_9BACT|nr:type II toxin-antitoxin system MqsA family antitoxin [Candidatus Methylomirabilis lanthanidiphila]VUZ86493.1 Antitoxin MqsA [Candidatus Methylomirabilis lanthanidiphila]
MGKQWNGQKCPACFQGTLEQGTQQAQFEYRGRVLEYKQEGAWCTVCREGIMTGKEAAASESLLDDFVARVDKQEAFNLARIRKKLGLTQKEAAMIAGGGHNAFSRYERGEAKPVAAVVNLFRLLDRHPELLKELKKRKAA